jgi:hypothetical protein
MSPNVDLEFNDAGILVATLDTEICFTWTYSDFEEHLNESITPSMYEFMANYVYSNITKDQLWDIESQDYCSGDLEEEAVNAYFNVPALDRQIMHAQSLQNLKAERQCAEDKEFAATDCPFDPTSPIYVEVMIFLKKLARENQKKRENLERMINEEKQWRGGWEAGEEV